MTIAKIPPNKSTRSFFNENFYLRVKLEKKCEPINYADRLNKNDLDSCDVKIAVRTVSLS